MNILTAFLLDLLGLALVACLPGALIYRVPAAGRAARAALAVEERLFWSIVISVAWSSLVVLGLASVGQYRFTRLLWLNAALIGGVALAWRGRLSYTGTAARPTWSVAIVAGILALGAFLFFPPSQHIIGGQDPGIYVNEGIQLAQRGALVIHDETVAAVPAVVRDLFFRSHQNPSYYGLRFMGFFILDPVAGTVVGQFPHLYPAWMAVGYGLHGLEGALYTTGAWALLGLLAVYLVGTRLLGRFGGASAAALLALSLVQIWFAREPNSEIVAQPLLLAALLAFTRAHVDRQAFFAPVAGVLLGLLLFLRFDAVLAIAGVGMAASLSFLDGRRPRIAFVLPLAGLAALALLYLQGPMAPYAARPFGFVRNLRPMHWAALSGAAAALLALVAVSRHHALAARLKRAVPYAFAAAVVAAAGYAYFLRVPHGRLAAHDALSFRTFAWYVPPAALAAAVAGYALVSWRHFWRDAALLVTTGVYTFFVFYKIQIVPVHFWMARRFVPMILPAAMLMLAGAACAALGRRGAANTASRPWLRGARIAIVTLCLGLVAISLGRASRAIAGHVEYDGLIPRIEAIANRFSPDDLLVVESRNDFDIHTLALPLAYVYDRRVLVLDGPRPDKSAFQYFLGWAHQRYRNVYFLGGGNTDLVARSIAVTPVASERFQVPEYDSPMNAYPTGVRRKEFDFGIYRFERAPRAPGPVTLDVGRYDDLNVVRFHAKERLGDVTFRWSRDTSYLTLPAIEASARRVTLWLNDGHRPPGTDPARVAVYLDDELLGEAQVGREFLAYAFEMPAELAAASARNESTRLKLVSNTWSPKAALGTGDDRQLGVMVDRVEVQ